MEKIDTDYIQAKLFKTRKPIPPPLVGFVLFFLLVPLPPPSPTPPLALAPAPSASVRAPPPAWEALV